MSEPTLEERVAKIETLIDKVIALAKQNPMGRLFVHKLLGE